MRHALSTLKLVRLGRPVNRLELEAVGSRILEAFVDVLSGLRVVDYHPPPVDHIEANLLTQALEQDVGGHILGITDADLLDRSGSEFFPFMFGCKDNRNLVAVVSMRRIVGSDRGRSIARLLKIALHELGHNFGLVHHYDFVPATDGAYCPMSKGDFNRHGERSYIRSVIDARGLRFCEGCRRFMRLAHGRRR